MFFVFKNKNESNTTGYDMFRLQDISDGTKNVFLSLRMYMRTLFAVTLMFVEFISLVIFASSLLCFLACARIFSNAGESVYLFN